MDVNSILNSVMGTAGKVTKSSAGSGALSGAAAGGLVSMLMSSKKMRKKGKKALKYGGVIAVGGLAYKAWRDHQNAKTNPQSSPVSTSPMPQEVTPPSGSIFDLAQQQVTPAGEDMRLVLVRAMISAAKSDGHIDAVEQSRIEEQIAALGIGPNEQQFLVDQLNAPSDPIVIAKLSNGPEEAAEIYAASVIAVDIDTAEERRYLDRLGDALHLPDDLRTRLEAETSGYLLE